MCIYRDAGYSLGEQIGLLLMFYILSAIPPGVPLIFGVTLMGSLHLNKYRDNSYRALTICQAM